jgi:hypothetical protein
MAAVNHVVNQAITGGVQDRRHRTFSFKPEDGSDMLSSFSKDWARWSRAERIVAQIAFLAVTVGLASQAVIHII